MPRSATSERNRARTAAKANAVPTIPGSLSPGQLAASMPVDAPLYQAPPFYYRDAHAIAVAYETDAEAAAALLPEGLDLPLPAIAQLIIVRYPFSTLGPYEEAILGISCRWQGEPRFYIAHIAVNSVPPLVAGREIWGFPKKMAHIELFEEEATLVGTLERPLGVRLATIVVRPERPLEIQGGAGGGSVSLRVIPSAAGTGRPSVAELIEVPTVGRVTHESWSGTGTLTFDTPSTLDPWYRLPVKAVLAATSSRYDFVLPPGAVLRTY